MGEFSQFALKPEQGAAPRMEQLDHAMQERIRALAARLDVRDSAAVMGFGAKAQKNMDAFSSIALSQMLSGDIKPLDGVMNTLAEQIKACSFSSEAKGLFRRMLGGASSLSQVRQAYEKAEPRINQCADEMTDRRVALMRDSALLDRLYERNEALYRELCSLLVVGGEVIRQAKERGESAQDSPFEIITNSYNTVVEKLCLNCKHKKVVGTFNKIFCTSCIKNRFNNFCTLTVEVYKVVCKCYTEAIHNINIRSIFGKVYVIRNLCYCTYCTLNVHKVITFSVELLFHIIDEVT